MRNYITYESLGIFISDYKKGAYSNFDSTEIKWISRVQNSDYGISLNRDVLKQIGSEDFYIQELNIQNASNPPSTSPTDEAIEPTISFNMSYLLTDGVNEKNIGIAVNKIGCETPLSFPFKFIKDQNIFVFIGKEHLDLLNQPSLDEQQLIEINNCYLSNYSLSVSVGSFPTVSTSWVGSNISAKKYSEVNDNFLSVINSSNPELPNKWDVNKSYLGTQNPENFTFNLPSVSNRQEPEIAALRPMDIVLDIPDLNIGGQKLNKPRLSVDSFSLNIDVSRKDLYGIGSNFVFDRKLDYPISGSLNMAVVIDDIQEGSLAKIFEKDKPYDMEITIHDPCLECQKERIKIKIEKAIFVSKKVSKQIGSVTTLDIEFYFSVTSDHGLYFFAEKNTDSQLFLKSKYDNVGWFDTEYFSDLQDQTDQQTNFENWLTNDGDPSLEVFNACEKSDLTVNLSEKTLLNSNLDQVGTIEYWTLDDSSNIGAGCVDVDDLNLNEEINTWEELKLKLNDLSTFCVGEKIVILYKYNDGVFHSENYRLVTFEHLPIPLLTDLSFNNLYSEVGYNYQISDSLFNLGIFINSLTVESELPEIKAVFQIKKSGNLIQEFVIEDAKNADFSTYDIDFLEQGDYTLSLIGLADCLDNLSLESQGEIETVFNFSVVYYELIIPTDLTYEAECPKTTNLPNAIINKNGEFLSHVSPLPLTLDLCLSDYSTPESTAVIWSEHLQYHYNFSETATATVSDTEPPDLLKLTHDEEILIHPDNSTSVMLSSIIQDAKYYDRCTLNDEVISYFIHEWDGGKKKSFIIIDPSDHFNSLLGGTYDFQYEGEDYTANIYDSISSVILNDIGKKYYYLNDEIFNISEFANNTLPIDTHIIKLYRLEDKAGNYKIFDYSIPVSMLNIEMPSINDYYIEAGHNTEYTPEKQSLKLIKGSKSSFVELDFSIFDYEDLNTPVSPPIIGELDDPSIPKKFKVVYNYNDNGFNEEFSYNVNIGDKTPPQVNKINFLFPDFEIPLPSNSSDFTFNDLNPDIDVYDLVSGYNVILTFMLCEGDFTSPTFLPNPIKTHIKENTDNYQINLTDFELFEEIDMEVSKQYSFILYSVKDQMGNEFVLSPYKDKGITFELHNPYPIEASITGEKIKLEPIYENASILFLYDASGSMTGSRWSNQITWMKKCIKILIELDTVNERRQGGFDLYFIWFSNMTYNFHEDQWLNIKDISYDSLDKFYYKNNFGNPKELKFGDTYSDNWYINAMKAAKNAFSRNNGLDKNDYKKILIFTTDGGIDTRSYISGDGGYVELDGAIDLAKDFYEPKDLNVGRITSIPILIQGVEDKERVKKLGRVGQGKGIEEEPDVIDATSGGDIGVLELLKYILPYNGQTSIDITNMSNKTLCINQDILLNGDGFDFYEKRSGIDYLIDGSESNKIAQVKFLYHLTQSQLDKTSSFDNPIFYIPPRGKISIYFSIAPTEKTYSKNDNYDPINLNVRFYDLLFAYIKNENESPNFSESISLETSQNDVSYNSDENYLLINFELELQLPDT